MPGKGGAPAAVPALTADTVQSAQASANQAPLEVPFLNGLFSTGFQEGERPNKANSGKRPIKVGKRPIKKGKLTIEAGAGWRFNRVLDGLFLARPRWWTKLSFSKTCSSDWCQACTHLNTLLGGILAALAVGEGGRVPPCTVPLQNPEVTL